MELDSVWRSSVARFEVAEACDGRVCVVVVAHLEIEVEVFFVVGRLLVPEDLAVEELIVVRSRLLGGRIVGRSRALAGRGSFSFRVVRDCPVYLRFGPRLGAAVPFLRVCRLVIRGSWTGLLGHCCGGVVRPVGLNDDVVRMDVLLEQVFF